MSAQLVSLFSSISLIIRIVIISIRTLIIRIRSHIIRIRSHIIRIRSHIIRIRSHIIRIRSHIIRIRSHIIRIRSHIIRIRALIIRIRTYVLEDVLCVFAGTFKEVSTFSNQQAPSRRGSRGCPKTLSNDKRIFHQRDCKSNVNDAFWYIHVCVVSMNLFVSSGICHAAVRHCASIQ